MKLLFDLYNLLLFIQAAGDSFSTSLARSVFNERIFGD